MKYRIGIVGSKGMVGGAVKRYFNNKPNYQLFLYDKNNEGSIDEINNADFVYICVPTPSDNSGGCDCSIVDEVIAQFIGNKVVVIKSTILPGTTDKFQEKYLQHKILFNPEFLTEITADQDMAFPDRQIVGFTEKSYDVAMDVIQQLPLAPFTRIVPAKEAEMVKYFNNSWFATKVIFANQIYDVCQKAGIDYNTVRDLASADKRIGRTHLEVWHKGYRGYGGKCLPKDTKALIQFADSLGVSMDLLKTVEEINKTLTCQTCQSALLPAEQDSSEAILQMPLLKKDMKLS